jgi:hypothetical protein
MLTKEDILGVVSYYHQDDGTPCKILNVFATSNEDIAVAIVQHGPNSWGEWRAVLAVQIPSVMNSIYDAISHMAKDELAEFLPFLIATFDSFKNPESYYRPLVEAFGTIMVDNIQLINSNNHNFSNFVRSKKVLPCYDLVADRAPEDYKLVIAKKSKLKQDAINAAKERMRNAHP